MSLLEAAIKDLEMIGDCRTCGNKDPFCESNPDSCTGYKWRGTKDDSKPLTLEELREMDREPVWCVIINGANKGKSFWGLVDGDLEECICTNWEFVAFTYYGMNWIAYCRKPEDGTE